MVDCGFLRLTALAICHSHLRLASLELNGTDPDSVWLSLSSLSGSTVCLKVKIESECTGKDKTTSEEDENVDDTDKLIILHTM